VIDKGDIYLFFCIGGLFLVNAVFSAGGAFPLTAGELAEEDPEIIDCVTSGGDCLPLDFAIDLIDLFLFDDLPIVAWLQILLTIVLLVLVLMGIVGVIL